MIGSDLSTTSKHLSILKNAVIIQERKGRPSAIHFDADCCRVHRVCHQDEYETRSIVFERRKPKVSGKKRILFLCTGNSCRSQMAEGFARALKDDLIEAYSAGIETHGLNPLAVRVMAEAGIDISGQKSKNVLEFFNNNIEFDYVITVCDHARESCPVYPAKTRLIHKGFDDPPALAETAKTEEEALEHYRRVRDEIRTFVETLPGALSTRH
ncbi:MAG: arsenate reductase ArsC [Spirochaetales bacterium]|nr:arsenate reductase ArsC [Spirochaetales bacterium]